MALYGSTTVSETFGDGMTEKVTIILSGYSSLILEMRRVPIPDPVPPPREWVTWKPGSWDVSSTGGFVVVDVDSLELEVRVTMVGTGWVNSVFVGDDLPEFGTDLVTALSSLDVNDFSHL